MENLYSVLGILPTASPDEIKDAYSRARAKLIATDVSETDVSIRLSALDDAYAILMDPGERTKYDRSLGSTTNPGATAALTLVERSGTILRQEPPNPVIQQPCPFCGSPNPVQASMCGQCGQQISRPCPSCGQAVLLTQPVCPRCNTFLPEYDQRRVTQAIITEQKTMADRRESEAKVQALEAGHRVRAMQGIVFWILAAIACLALTIIPIVVFNYVMNNP